MSNIKIIPGNHQRKDIELYLNCRNLHFEYYDEWDFSSGNRFIVPKGDCLLVMPYTLLNDLDIDSFINDVNSSDCRIYFCQQFDNIIFYRKFETFIDYITRPIYLHVDGVLHHHNPRVTTTKFEFTGVICNTHVNTSHARDKDFLLTTCLHPRRVHRHVLVDKLKQTKLLSNYAGAIHYTKHHTLEGWENREREWAGTTPSDPNQIWVDGQIFWDLYNSAFYELVPETLHDYASFTTEKIWKPIVAKIPFICLSDYKFYDTLHSLGFKTFDSIIDESFASEPDLKTRVEKIIHTMSNINPKDFYIQSREICEENYKTLCYFHYKNNNEFYQQLDKIFI